MFFFFFFFFSGLLVVGLVNKHYFLSLMGLELVFLSLLFLSFFYVNCFDLENFFCIYFLVLGVCEGVLGLSLLVFIVRSFGSDYVDSEVVC